MKRMGRIIKAFRGELGLNQAEFAKVMKTTQSNVSKIEAGKLYPTFLMFRRAWFYGSERSAQAMGAIVRALT
jgi:predicted transcriptional regulator